MEKIVYCNNCGEKGHLFKACKEPIISCGIMLVNQSRLPSNEPVKILMVRRKDSMAYTEFLRGKYDPEKQDYVRKLLSNMNISEHLKLKVSNFDALWTSHWGVGRDHHSHEYEISKQKFNKLDFNILLTGIVGYPESEWGFPKGRRMHRESDVDCAIREFDEETNIPRKAFTVCNNLLLTETFAGTNEIMYKHNYFVAIINADIDITSEMTVQQKREVSAIAWKSIPECHKLTRPHYLQRTDLLNSFERIVNTFNVENN